MLFYFGFLFEGGQQKLKLGGSLLFLQELVIKEVGYGEVDRGS